MDEARPINANHLLSSQNHGSVTHWIPLPEAPKGVA